MPPVGNDERVQAIHVLNVLDCAKTLVAAIAQCGGIGKINIEQPDVQAALAALFAETSKLQVYEVRAKARGTVATFDATTLSQAIKDVRDKRVLTAEEREVSDATPAQIDEAFSLDEPESADATAEEPAPDSGTAPAQDAFSL